MEIRKLVVPELKQLLDQRDKGKVLKQEMVEDDPVRLDVDEAISRESDMNTFMDDDPNDGNWTPDEDIKADVHLNNENWNQTDNTTPASSPSPQLVVKTMRIRGKDKKKRKKKTILKGFKRGPYNKKERAPRPPRVRIRPKKVKVEVKLESTDDNPINDRQATAVVKKVPPRGKDKTKRKSKPRLDRPKRILYPCSSCASLPFTTYEELESHEKLHQERRLLKERIEQGEEYTGEKLDCDQCTFPARDALELGIHIRNRHIIAPLREYAKRYTCPICSRRFRWLNILVHLKSKHSTPEEEEQVTAFNDRYLNCDQCDFRGTLPRQVTIHKRKTHLPNEVEAPVREEDCLRCNECGVICTSAKELKIHVDNKHNRLDRFVCVECGAGFPYQVRLNDHMNTHTKHLKRDWVCHVCGVDFPRRRQLDRHCETYHREDEGDDDGNGVTEGKIYKCRYCDLTSPYNAVIRKHLETHKQQGDHRCEKCGRCYMNAQGLKRHLRINHSEGGEQVLCPHCLKGFPSREYMMVHIKRYCKLKDLPVKGESREVPSSTSEENLGLP